MVYALHLDDLYEIENMNSQVQSKVGIEISSPLHISQVPVLLPHMLSQLVFASVAPSLTLVTSKHRAQMKCLVNAMDSCFVADTVRIAPEGHEATELVAWNWNIAAKK